MDYKTFKEIVIERLLMCLPEGAWVEDVEIARGNRLISSGISIIYPSKYMSPVLYLEPFFNMACENVRMGQIINDILMILKAVDTTKKNCAERTNLQWTNIQDKVYPRLVNYKKNQKFLSEVPHERFLDLAVVYYIDIPMQSDVSGYMAVRMPLFEMWDIELQELQDSALRNLQNHVAPNIVNAYDLRIAVLLNGRRQKINEPDDTLLQDSENGLEELPDSEEMEKLKRQYILSAPKFIYGAEILLRMDVIEGLAEMLQADLYIVPLAVDAVEMIPVGKGISLEEIYEEMRTVESMKMESVDYLSGKLYLYGRDIGKITIISVEESGNLTDSQISEWPND